MIDHFSNNVHFRYVCFITLQPNCCVDMYACEYSHHIQATFSTFITVG